MLYSYPVPLRAAFIGGAVESAIGQAHFVASRMDGHFTLDAGCFSRSEATNGYSAARYGVSEHRAYTSWEEMLRVERGRIDVVIVLTPTPTHAEIVTAAITAGYRVVCEKALGVSSAECAAISAIAELRKAYLAVTFNYSGYPMVRELRQWIADGRLGELHCIQVEMPQEGFLRLGANPQNWRRVDHKVPTVSLDLGVHVHHLASFLLGGRRPVRIIGDEASSGQFSGIIDSVHCLVQYEDGIRMNAWWGKTFLGHRNGLKVRVYGRLGSAEWYQMDPEHLRWSDNDGHTMIVDRGSGQARLAQDARYNRFKSGHPSGFIEAFGNLYADVAQELRAGAHRPGEAGGFVYGALHALEGLQMMEAARESAAAGAWVDIPRLGV